MTMTELAEQLREKIQQRGEISFEMLAKLDDDFIVESYLSTACQDCGRKLAEGLDVEQVLAESQSLDDFFDRCADAKEHAHPFVYCYWPTEL